MLEPVNQNPEQIARDQIDKRLLAAGWLVQDKSSLNPNAALGVAVREYPTDTGPADYVLFVDGRLCCTNPVRDSSRESSMVAGWDEQTHTLRLHD